VTRGFIAGSRRLSFVLLIAAVASVTLVAGPLLTPSASAEIAACYTDPVVVLSNGMTLDISDTIYDAYSDVQQISYTLHLPAGVRVVSVTYTSGPIGPKETLSSFSDGSMGQYAIASAVTTGASSISVVASAEAVSTAGISDDSTAGWNNQQLRLTVSG
jgi:hypothetical protein